MTNAGKRGTRSLDHWLGIDGARRRSGNLRVDAPTPAPCDCAFFLPSSINSNGLTLKSEPRRRT